jgi:adhesin transport system outer membrane protein
MNERIWARPQGCAMYVLLHMLLVTPVALRAQVLPLNDAISQAIGHYPLLRQRQAQVEAGKAHIQSVNDNRLPALNLQEQWTLGTNNSLDGAYFGMGVVPSTTGGVENTNSGQVNSGNIATAYLQWNVYNFGYYNALEQVAKSQLATTQASLEREKYLLTTQVISLYLDALKKYRLLRVEAENEQRSATILAAIRATAAGGLRPGVDSVTAGAAYSEARLTYLQALDDFSRDKIALAIYTGLDTARIQPDTTVAEKMMSLAGALKIASDSVPLSHPLLDVYQKQYETAVAENRSISRQYLPKVGLEAAGWTRSSSIDAAGDYGGTGEGWGYQRYNYLFGLSITYNLFDLKKRHDQLREGAFQVKASEEAVNDQHLQLDKVMQQAGVSYVTVLQQLKELQVQRSSAQQAYLQQLALYEGGMNTLIDVTNALYVLRSSETSYVVRQDELLQILYARAGLSNQLDVFLQNFK